MKKKDGSLNKMVVVISVMFLIFAGVLFGFGKNDNSDESSVQTSNMNLPNYAYSSPMTLKAYEYTTLNPWLIQQVPCYCECFRMGHNSLKSCFITENGTYDNHASQCDICVGEVIKVKKMYEDGMDIENIRIKIDEEYKKYGQPTNTSLKSRNVTNSVMNPIDYSNLSLTEEFDSLSDGLKMTPYGVNWARFINIKAISRSSLEQYTSDMIRPVEFYGLPLIGMYSGDYSTNSWIELHDIGRNNVSVNPRDRNGMSNIVTDRPFVYGHSDNVKRIAGHLAEMDIEQSSYPDYQSVLDIVDDENAAIASVTKDVSAFSDITYTGFTILEDENVEMVRAYHITDAESIPPYIYDSEKTASNRGFDTYKVTLESDVLEITMVADLSTLLDEKV
jgi:hypothetical protein